MQSHKYRHMLAVDIRRQNLTTLGLFPLVNTNSNLEGTDSIFCNKKSKSREEKHLHVMSNVTI